MFLNLPDLLVLLTMKSIERKTRMKHSSFFSMKRSSQNTIEEKKRKLKTINKSSHSCSKTSTKKEYHPFNSSCRRKALKDYKHMQSFSESALKG